MLPLQMWASEAGGGEGVGGVRYGTGSAQGGTGETDTRGSI